MSTMDFVIQDKVAIVTGGASGIGFYFSKELLRNGAKGVAIVDINKSTGEKAVHELGEEFGKNKVIFIEADTSDMNQFEGVFVQTIERFNNVDILMNNAGISNDYTWQREISININGTINGMILGMEKYLSNHKVGNNAIIVNTSSITAIDGYPSLPVYSATKAAILALTRSWGTDGHYADTKVRVVAICPGATKTPLAQSGSTKIAERYKDVSTKYRSSLNWQEPEFLAKEAMRIIRFAKNGSVWIVEGEEPSYEYIFPNRTTMKANTLQ